MLGISGAHWSWSLRGFLIALPLHAIIVILLGLSGGRRPTFPRVGSRLPAKLSPRRQCTAVPTLAPLRCGDAHLGQSKYLQVESGLPGAGSPPVVAPQRCSASV